MSTSVLFAVNIVTGTFKESDEEEHERYTKITDKNLGGELAALRLRRRLRLASYCSLEFRPRLSSLF